MKNRNSVLQNLRNLRIKLEQANKDTPLTEVPVPAAVLLDDVITALNFSSFERGYVLGGTVIKNIDDFWSKINQEAV